MKTIILSLLPCILIIYTADKLISQMKSGKVSEKTQLVSDELLEEGKKLDEQIDEVYKKIQEVILKYKLLETKDILLLPYRTTYKLGNNYIEIEKYDIKRDSLFEGKISGIDKKIVKIFMNSGNLSRIESEIIEQKVGIGFSDSVTILDPSPASIGTDDISFTQIIKNKKLMDNKKLGEIRNNRVFPLRNNIKKDFIIPHINFVYNTILDIAETYYIGIKDTDSMLSDFLKKSTQY